MTCLYFAGSLFPFPDLSSSASPHQPVQCKFYPNCTKPNCLFYHPPKKVSVFWSEMKNSRARVLCGMAWFGVAWRGMVWCVVWCGVVWCDVMWCDVGVGPIRTWPYFAKLIDRCVNHKLNRVRTDNITGTNFWPGQTNIKGSNGLPLRRAVLEQRANLH